MIIIELIEQLKAMPEKMEGRNGEGELVVINTHKLAEYLKKSLRNCDVGTAYEQTKRFIKFCKSRDCARSCLLLKSNNCELAWAQMPYEEAK